MKCPPILAIKASTGQDAVDALDRAGVQRGVLLSTAYMFGSPEVAGLGLDVGKETRQENEFVVDQAQAHCDRLAAFISVAPLSPNAVDEVAYWAGTGRATGLKLHLQNSDFSFRSPEQVRKLAAIVATAGKARFPMIIHLHTRAPDFGPQDVEIFLREVLPLALGTPVQIAHAAGEGGLNAPSLAALGVFADAAKKDPSATASLYFDLAMVPDLALGIVTIKASAGKVVALQGLMRRIGMDRFLLGSDWTSPRDLRAYYADERAAFDLTDAEWRTVATNQAPYLPPRATAPAAGPPPNGRPRWSAEAGPAHPGARP